MRLIDADELLRTFTVNSDGRRIPEKDCDNFDLTISLKEIKRIIKERPTAYDVDNVITELSDLRVEYFFKIPKGEKYYYAFMQVINAIDKAIEIVKRGGSN